MQLQTSTRLHQGVRATFESVARAPPVVLVAESSRLQRLAFSPTAQRVQGLVMSQMPHINQVRSLGPVRLAERYLEVLVNMAVPEERRHNIVIVGLKGKDDSFHLLRRHPSDRYEAGWLDNVTGHLEGKASSHDDYVKTAHREIGEETSLPATEMIKSGSARMMDMGGFGWLMHLRTRSGLEPSLVYGRMFLLEAPDVEARHIRLKADEHVEVVSLKMPQIIARSAELAVFDRFFFSANRWKLDAPRPRS